MLAHHGKSAKKPIGTAMVRHMVNAVAPMDCKRIELAATHT